MNPVSRAGLRLITEDYRKKVVLARVKDMVKNIYNGVMASASSGLYTYRETLEITGDIEKDVEAELRRIFVGATIILKRDVYRNVQGIEITW
jgi:hypothetical protein